MLHKRILAFLIDYLLIAGYAALLLGLSLLVFRGRAQMPELGSDPVFGQLIGALSLTLPVFAYFFLSESGYRRATFGKRCLRIKVEVDELYPAKNVLVRTIFKLLPWEIAHTGVHWLLYFVQRAEDVPPWVWALLIAPQTLVFFYGITILMSGGESSLYDRIAGTRIIPQE
ncbi:MAG: RDD family protein [Saprospiraceae bacterium]|nr:RDD family protein [Saprospiraceae bacterium]